MAFDPSVISDIGNNTPDVVGGVAKGFQLKDMIDENQLNKLKLATANQEAADNQTKRKLYSSGDVSSEKGSAELQEKLNAAGLPEEAMKLRKYTQEVTSGELQNKIQQIQLADKALDWSASQFDPVYQKASQMRTAMVQDPRTGRPKPAYTEAEINAYIQSQAPTVLKNLQDADDSVLPAQYRQTALQHAAQGGGPKTYDDLQRIEDQSAKQRQIHQQQLVQMNITSEIASRGDQRDETARHNKVEEGQGQQKVDIAARNAASFGPQSGDLMAALAERGVSIPAGFRSKQQQSALYQGLFDRNPGKSADEIAEGIAKGQIEFGAQKKETQTAAGIVGKVEVGENELIEFAPKALAASAKVPRGDFVPFNKLRQKGEASISDPDLKEFYGRTNAILNAYDVVSSRGGTDKEKRAENRKNLETADSPAAYQRAVETMVDEARLAKKAAVSATRVPELNSGKGVDKSSDPLGIR